MNNLIVPSGDLGLSQAWRMATVGTKPTQRRTLKRDLNEVSIPRLCEKVSTLATETSSLRLTSNLLYGLSLIYKQKVAFMATDLALVYERLATPLFTKGNVQRQTLKRPRALTGINMVSMIPDNPRFNVDVDFVDDFLDEYFLEEHESQVNALMIREQDKGIGGVVASKVPAYMAAEAQEKLFLDYMNRTNTTRELSLEECLMVDFEFDENGYIIDHNNEGGEEHENLLQDLNLDEEIVAASKSISDKSGSISLAENENPLNLGQMEANTVDVNQATNCFKRRKFRPVVDRHLTISTSRQLGPPAAIQQSVKEVFNTMSLSQPPFLNMCYRIIFGTSDDFQINVEKLPLKSRHANTSKLDSFLKEMEDEIERGRNIPSRRPTLSLMDGVMDEALYELPILTPTAESTMEEVDFDIEPLSPLPEMEEDKEMQGQTQKLKDFEQCLDERVVEITTRDPQLMHNGFSLELLFPSRPTTNCNPVVRRLAANSVSCLLQLASTGVISLRTTTEEMRPLHPSEVYVDFV